MSASSSERQARSRPSLHRRDGAPQRRRRADDDLFRLHDEEKDKPARDEPWPDAKRDRLVAEHRLERPGVGEQQLQDDDREDAVGQIFVAQMRFQRQRRVDEVAAVQQVEDLSDRDRIDCDRPGELVRGAFGLHPEECEQRVDQKRKTDEDDAPDAEAGHDGAVHRARRPLHHVDLMRFEADHQAERDGGDHVDPEDLRRGDRHGEAEKDRHRNNQRLRHVGRQQEQHRLLDVIVDRPAFLHRRSNRGEVVVGQNHPRGLFGHLGALDSHRDANVGLLERGRIVHAVTRHRHDLPVGLDRLHQPQLVLRTRAGKDVDVADALLQRGGVHLLDLRACDRRLAVADSEHLGDGRGGDLVIAGNHRDPDPAAVAFLHRLDGLLARGVEQSDQAEQDEGLRQVVRTESASFHARILKPREPQHPLALGGEPV